MHQLALPGRAYLGSGDKEEKSVRSFQEEEDLLTRKKSRSNVDIKLAMIAKEERKEIYVC